MKSNQIYFISGVSGVGKTSTVSCLKKMLPADKYNIRDFDERGVPDGGGQTWHDNETRYWLQVAELNAKKGKSTIISGFANPDQFKKVHKPNEDISAQLILLHTSADTLRKRLYGRHSTPKSIQEINRASGVSLDTFVENNVSFSPKLRAVFEDNGSVVIETDTKTPEEVAQEICKVIKP